MLILHKSKIKNKTRNNLSNKEQSNSFLKMNGLIFILWNFLIKIILLLNSKIFLVSLKEEIIARIKLRNKTGEIFNFLGIINNRILNSLNNNK
jgi:hypothetical protein